MPETTFDSAGFVRLLIKPEPVRGRGPVVLIAVTHFVVQSFQKTTQREFIEQINGGDAPQFYVCDSIIKRSAIRLFLERKWKGEAWLFAKEATRLTN